MTIGVILAAAYFAIALFPWIGMEKEAVAKKNLVFISITLGALFLLDAWFWAVFGAPLFLRDIMMANQPDWNQSLVSCNVLLSTPVDDFFTLLFLPVLQYIFLFLTMVLILVLFIYIFLYFSQVESSGKAKKTIFVVILALIVLFFVQSWFFQIYGADLLLRGYFG